MNVKMLYKMFFLISTFPGKKLSHVQNIEFYLLQSLKNKLFDFHNRETKINRINYEDIFINNEDGIVEQIINKEKQLEIKNIISQFLQKLPPKQRKIIYYHYQLNLNIEEIATILEMTTPAVKKITHTGSTENKGDFIRYNAKHIHSFF